MNALLEIVGVGKAYKRRSVFERVDLSLEEGQKLLLTGPSGCGKTTLLRLITGLEAPDDGEICIGGQIASSRGKILFAPHRRGAAMVFQDLGLWPNLNAVQNVLLGLSGAKLQKAERLERAREALRCCEIEQSSGKRPSQLSGGELQRVALARALAVRPQLLLLDEPFGGLDLTLKNSLLRHIHELSERLNITVIMASHNPSDARLLSADVAVLEDGLLCERGTLEQLTRAPRSRTMKAWRETMLGFASESQRPAEKYVSQSVPTV
jgi:ABC-type Fe3+/spermidine/putrescine transport system ATPase subunit